MIEKPGVYDIPAEAYHADPCPEPSLSASIAKLLVNKTPLHAWTEHARLNPNFTPKQDGKFDIGTAAHALILNDERAFEIVAAENWTTKAAREARALARISGKIPLLTEQWERVQRMVKIARKRLADHIDAHDAFTNGKPEQTLVWLEEGVMCRARLDWRRDTGNIFDDYKTSESADPDAFTRTIANVGHDIQAALYLRGIKALGLCDNPRWRWIVQEPDEPHALSAIAPMPGMIELGDRKVMKALNLWRECRESGRWSGYPNRTCYVDTPNWHESQYMEREVRDDEAAAEAAEYETI